MKNIKILLNKILKLLLKILREGMIKFKDKLPEINNKEEVIINARHKFLSILKVNLFLSVEIIIFF